MDRASGVYSVYSITEHTVANLCSCFAKSRHACFVSYTNTNICKINGQKLMPQVITSYIYTSTL